MTYNSLLLRAWLTSGPSRLPKRLKKNVKKVYDVYVLLHPHHRQLENDHHALQ